MAQPGLEFVLTLRSAWRLLRWLLLGAAAIVALLCAAQVHSLYQLFRGVHPLLGVLFLAVAATGLWWLVGVPVVRFLRMPVAVKPPPLPALDAGLTPTHLDVHLRYVARYLRGQLLNPRMRRQRAEVEAAVRECEALRARVTAPGAPGLREVLGEVEAFERERVDRLLAPLDAEAERVIRQEALGVGVATAVTLNGTVDALIVLWRNVNLIAKLAQIYYGRPGPRGTLAILRDVSLTVLLANYLDDLSDWAGSMIGKWMGTVAGLVAGPLINGGANAVLTLRVGYLAKDRCRTFEAWTEERRRSVLAKCFGLAAEASKGVLTELASRVGGLMGGIVGGVVGGTAGAGSFLLRSARDLFTGAWWRGGPEEGKAEPAG